MGAVTAHRASLRTAQAETVRTDANTGGTPRLVIGTSALSLPSTGVLANVALGSTFGAASGPTISATAPAAFNASAGGTAALAIVTRADGTECYRGAVTTDSTGIVQLNSLTIANGDLITITAPVTYTAPV